MSRLLTRVALHFGRDLFNHYLRFGEPLHREDLDRRRAFGYFAPGALFGYVRWEANDYGTRDWRFWVLRAGDLTSPLHRVEGVTPGAEVLLETSGATFVPRAFGVIDAIEGAGIDPAEVSPEYYIRAHQMLAAHLPVPSYDRSRHRAHILRRKVFG